MLIFNWMGFGMMMLWVGLLTVTMKVTGERSQVLLGMLLGAIVVIIIDIVLRLVYMRSNAARLPILHPKTGGHLFFIPIWIVMTLAGIVGTLVYIRGNG